MIDKRVSDVNITFNNLDCKFLRIEKTESSETEKANLKYAISLPDGDIIDVETSYDGDHSSYIMKMSNGYDVETFNSKETISYESLSSPGGKLELLTHRDQFDGTKYYKSENLKLNNAHSNLRMKNLTPEEFSTKIQEVDKSLSWHSMYDQKMREPFFSDKFDKSIRNLSQVASILLENNT